MRRRSTYVLMRSKISRNRTNFHPVVQPKGLVMDLLLTSSGLSNATNSDALVDLLGKPISESSALFIPTAIYPFPGRARMA